jgi:hypothetical protein
MDYHGLVKRLDLPAGWMPPTELEYDDIRARAISRADNDDDVRAINASIELIRRTRGGNWPTEPVSVDFNYVDEVWHECEFREGDSFTYAVYDSRGQYLGCCYLYPVGRRTPLTEELLTYDVDVSWWVTPGAYERGYYAKLYAALRHWIEAAFPFTKAYYSNTEIPELPARRRDPCRPRLRGRAPGLNHPGAQIVRCGAVASVVADPGVQVQVVPAINMRFSATLDAFGREPGLICDPA